MSELAQKGGKLRKTALRNRDVGDDDGVDGEEMMTLLRSELAQVYAELAECTRERDAARARIASAIALLHDS